jgi:starch phosphorylase
MINGAITLCTLDGANVEMRNVIGKDNIVIFGMTAKEVNDLKTSRYNPFEHYKNNPIIKNALDVMSHNFSDITDSLKTRDPYMVLADFQDYSEKKHHIWELYEDEIQWARMSLINIAKSGVFSGDRAINEYANNIWGTRPAFF